MAIDADARSGIPTGSNAKSECYAMLTNSPTATDGVPADGGAESGYAARSQLSDTTSRVLANQPERTPAARSIIPRIRATLTHAARLRDESEALAPTQDPQRRFRSLFVSDTHLGAKGCRADRLLDFL